MEYGVLQLHFLLFPFISSFYFSLILLHDKKYVSYMSFYWHLLPVTHSLQLASYVPPNDLHGTIGGRVKSVHGTSRMYLPHDDIPGLAMSRSLGDYAAHTAGLIWFDLIWLDLT